MSAPTAASTPTGWWLTYPDVWAAERAALAAAGATWSEHTAPGPDGPADPTATAAGAPPRLRLRVGWPHPAPRPGDPAVLALTVTYPAAYPWFAPTVRLAEPLPALRRHRNPLEGTLCLLADHGDWRPGTTVADLLAEQLPRLLAAGRAPGTGAASLALEAGAETAWTRTRLSLGGLLVDSGSIPPAEVPGGWADLIRIGGSLASVAALVTVLDTEHRVLWESRAFGLREVARIRWVRLPDLPGRGLEPGELWDRAAERIEALGPDDFGSDEPKVVLVLVPSEGAGRHACEEWLLLSCGRPRPEVLDAVLEPTDPDPEPVGEPVPVPARAAGQQLELFAGTDLLPTAPAAPGNTGRPAPAVRVRVRRSFPIGRADLAARLPGTTARLGEAAVTVVGVGALGGPVALELARAGVGRLRLIDGDAAHDPASGARQLLTLRDTGSPKALALALRLLDSHPHLHVTAGLRDLGADDGRELPDLAASTLVVDCAANPAASRYLAAHLRVAGTPLLIASATAGGWGGVITTLPAAGGGCWECLQWHRAERTIPWPPARRDGAILPVGCSDPTYEGGWWDLGAVALQAARTALALLTTSAAGGPGAGSAFGDVQVLTQYRRGRPVHPRWQARALTVHPACPLHSGVAHGRRAAPGIHR